MPRYHPTKESALQSTPARAIAHKPFTTHWLQPMVAAFAALSLLGLIGCGDAADSVEITQTIERSPLRPEPNLEASSAERFVFAKQMAPMAQGMSGGELQFHWTAPKGWQELAPTEFRTANFRIGPNGEGEVSMAVMPGGGGGALQNANRWRANQMGLEPYTPAEFSGLERYEIMGHPATYVEFSGDYTGMGSTVVYSDAKLIGLLIESDPAGALGGNGVFIKMVGPADVVDAERGAFEQFATSLHASTDGHTHDDEHVHVAGDEHNHVHPPIEGVSTTAGETALGADVLPEGHPPIAPVTATADELPPGHPPISPGDIQVAQAQPGPAQNTGADSSGAGAYTWTVPEGWTKANDRPMRLVTFTLGPDNNAECYISVLGGTAGGMTMNLNRWRAQFGQPPLSDEEIEKLPKMELLGEEVPLLHVSGDFEGMDGSVQTGQALLGAAAVNPSGSVFVKLVGPAEVVSEQVDAFKAFCASMQERE